MTAAEIDAHADSARIWATIMDIRNEKLELFLETTRGKELPADTLDRLRAVKTAMEAFLRGKFTMNDLANLKDAVEELP